MRVAKFLMAATVATGAAATPAQMIGIGPSVLTLREADAAKGVITVKMNQQARILLPTNSSTGHQWSYGEINNIGIDGPIAVLPAGSSGPYGTVGQSETAVARIQFRGLSGGASISFNYVRSLANGKKSPPAQSVRFRFRVEP